MRSRREGHSDLGRRWRVAQVMTYGIDQAEAVLDIVWPFPIEYSGVVGVGDCRRGDFGGWQGRRAGVIGRGGPSCCVRCTRVCARLAAWKPRPIPLELLSLIAIASETGKTCACAPCSGMMEGVSESMGV